MSAMDVDTTAIASEFSVGAFAKGKGKQVINSGTDAKMAEAREGLPWSVLHRDSRQSVIYL